MSSVVSQGAQERLEKKGGSKQDDDCDAGTAEGSVITIRVKVDDEPNESRGVFEAGCEMVKGSPELWISMATW